MTDKKVRIVSSNDVGIVKDVYSNEIAVIQLEDGSLVKVSLDDIEVIQEETEDKDKNEVSISMNQFMRIVAKNALQASKGDLTVGMLYILFGELLAREIFGKKAEND